MHGIWLLLSGVVLLFSSQAMDAARQALQVFGASVLPALFPMMVLGALAGSGQRPGHRRTFSLVLFGFCAGSPASARQASLLHQCSPFSRRQLLPLLCMSGVMSPMFFVGSLAELLGSAAGWLLLLCHWAAALATGGICRWLYRKKVHCSEQPASVHPPAQANTPSAPNANTGGLSAALPAAISSAAQALLSVLGAMMLFAILAALVQSLLARLFPRWAASHSLLLSLIWALMEVGGGSLALAGQGAPPWLLCGLCSFGGLSIWLQNLLFIGQMIRPTELLGWRMLHGALGALFSFLALHFLPATLATVAAAQASPGHVPWLALILLTALALPRLRAS